MNHKSHKHHCTEKAVYGKAREQTEKTKLFLEYLQAANNNTLEAFNKNHCLTIIPQTVDTATNEYILLEIADWNCKSTKSIFEILENSEGKPDVIVLKDGVATLLYSHNDKEEHSVGFGCRLIDKEERQRIDKAYEEWKKRNN